MDKETKKGLKIGFSLVGTIIICAIADAFVNGLPKFIFFGTLLTAITVYVLKKYK